MFWDSAWNAPRDNADAQCASREGTQTVYNNFVKKNTFFVDNLTWFLFAAHHDSEALAYYKVRAANENSARHIYKKYMQQL